MLEWRKTCHDCAKEFVALVLCLFIASCSRVPVQEGVSVVVEPASPPTQVAKQEPRSRYGNPASYVVFGKTYKTFKSSHGFKERGVHHGMAKNSMVARPRAAKSTTCIS